MLISAVFLLRGHHLIIPYFFSEIQFSRIKKKIIFFLYLCMQNCDTKIRLEFLRYKINNKGNQLHLKSKFKISGNGKQKLKELLSFCTLNWISFLNINTLIHVFFNFLYAKGFNIWSNLQYLFLTTTTI